MSLKLESMQPTGSFKVRGAIAACSALPAGSRIVTASAGNHALGTAWASAKLGVPATVVVAETASSAKREALAKLPIELIVHGRDYDTAEAFGIRLAADPNRHATFVSPYNDPQVIAGQST
ncbi:MAG: pyridoxal-phosphate dependent enzyme, partial [Thermomicrobiales bacterium]